MLTFIVSTTPESFRDTGLACLRRSGYAQAGIRRFINAISFVGSCSSVPTFAVADASVQHRSDPLTSVHPSRKTTLSRHSSSGLMLDGVTRAHRRLSLPSQPSFGLQPNGLWVIFTIRGTHKAYLPITSKSWLRRLARPLSRHLIKY